MQLYDLDKVPELMDARCDALTLKDGRTLRTALWPAKGPNPKGTICLLQGRAEFIEKYYETISELRDRGFAVATFDWCGQGGSDRILKDPLKGHIHSFETYIDDLDQFIHKQLLADCPPPHFALAHSMGGLILLNALPRLRTIFERAILSAPLIAIAQEQRRLLGMTLQQSTIKKLSGFFRAIGLGKSYVAGASRSPFDKLGFETNLLTSDGPRYDRNRKLLQDYPDLAIAGPTNRWVHSACTAMAQLGSSDFQSSIHTPTLIITASVDKIVCSKEAEYFASILRAGHAISIPGSRHEILMERPPLRAQFWAAFDAFIPGTNTHSDQNIG